MTSPDQELQIEKVWGQIYDDLKKLLIPTESIKSISASLGEEMMERLNSSKESMLPSNLNILRLYKNNNDLLSPYNHNKILTIDFGGTTLKVAVIKTYPALMIDYLHSFDIEDRYVDSKFFEKIIQSIIDHLHDKFFDFFYDNDLVNNKILNIPVSITFSFPLNSKFEITSMGKGYILSDEIKNINFLIFLQGIFDKVCMENNIHDSYAFTIKDNLIINDSIAVHLTNTYIKQFHTANFVTDSHPYIPPSSSSLLVNSKGNSISFILGTGTNASFELPLERLPEFKQLELKNRKNNTPFEKGSSIVINAELGFLGKDCIELTNFDYIPDDPSKLMPLEFISSGRYLPSVLQKVILKYPILCPPLADLDNLEEFLDGIWFGKLCNIEDDFDLKEITSELKSALPHLENDDINLEVISQIAQLLVQRASIYIVATLMELNSLISNHKLIGKRKVDIGFVGSTLAFSKYYQDQIANLSNGFINLVFLQDSSLFGAAISTLL